MFKCSNVQMFKWLLFLLILSIIGCDITSDTPITSNSNIELRDTVLPQSWPAEYFFNNHLVSEGTFSLEDSTLYLVFEGVQANQAGAVRWKIHAFTSKSGYTQFGDSRGWYFSTFLQIEEHLAAYAERTGAIMHYETTGEVSQSYTDYEEEYVARVLAGVKPRSTIAMLHKDFIQGPSAPTFPGIGLPVMWPGWNNKTSAFTPLLIGGVHNVYDRWFYGRRIGTISGFIGYKRIHFNGPLASLNDKASSWWSFGL